MDPAAKVLASTWTPDQRALKNGRAYPSVYTTAPQIWTYEKDNYRAFVSIPGHNWKTFELPQYRAVLLRGIAWAGQTGEDRRVLHTRGIGQPALSARRPVTPERRTREARRPSGFQDDARSLGAVDQQSRSAWIGMQKAASGWRRRPSIPTGAVG